MVAFLISNAGSIDFHAIALSQDAAIRNLVTPKMEELGYLLNNSRRRQELHHAYGSPA